MRSRNLTLAGIVAAALAALGTLGLALTALPHAARAGDTQPAAKKQRKVKYWVAPMDPNYRRDKPGKSPMGMDLVPVYADDDEGGSDPNLVKIDPVVVQDIGVRTALVERATLSREVRTIGNVVPAEDRLWVVNLRFSGWITHLYVDQTGVAVKKGERLFDVYSPELVSAEQEYLVALRTSGAGSPLAQSSRRRLVYYGLPSWQIARIASEKKTSPLVTITAPGSGVVLHKNVVEGARVAAGKDLFRIADLSVVWIEAQVYDYDAPWVAVGDAATMQLSYDPGRTYAGKVTFVDPTLDIHTRTLRVRLEVSDPKRDLKPGMFATVQIAAAPRKDVIVVPTEAIIHSGTREVVFVVKKLGHYEATVVTTGLEGAGYMTQILTGLSPGDRVVTSAQFLLDSESQLREAAAKMSDTGLEKPPASATGGGTKPSAARPHDMKSMKMDHPEG